MVILTNSKWCSLNSRKCCVDGWQTMIFVWSIFYCIFFSANRFKWTFYVWKIFIRIYLRNFETKLKLCHNISFNTLCFTFFSSYVTIEKKSSVYFRKYLCNYSVESVVFFYLRKKSTHAELQHRMTLHCDSQRESSHTFTHEADRKRDTNDSSNKKRSSRFERQICQGSSLFQFIKGGNRVDIRTEPSV